MINTCGGGVVNISSCLTFHTHGVQSDMARPRNNGSRVVRSAAELIKLAGGPTVLARKFGVSAQAVCNWRVRGLPTHTCVPLSKFLQARGYSASPALWPLIRQTDLID